jgi:hypothetical protein
MGWGGVSAWGVGMGWGGVGWGGVGWHSRPLVASTLAHTATRHQLEEGCAMSRTAPLPWPSPARLPAPEPAPPTSSSMWSSSGVKLSCLRLGASWFTHLGGGEQVPYPERRRVFGSCHRVCEHVIKRARAGGHAPAASFRSGPFSSMHRPRYRPRPVGPHRRRQLLPLRPSSALAIWLQFWGPCATTSCLRISSSWSGRRHAVDGAAG